ncbi:hypothetical protein [Streptomyces sp. NPDC048644]|uniref:hypothetical protein n=1 Tax=Streptomyces sp. NPDC048644 TaxID=3365582 RepID=UPI00371489EC
MEQWTEERNRRADLHVVLGDGARLALEAQRELITDELWQVRHCDYADAHVRDVWFMRPDTRIPHVLFAEGTPAWTLYHRDETAEARLGEPHPRGPQWRTTDLRLFGLHHPPCGSDPVVRERFALTDLGLDAQGVTFPPAMTARLVERSARIQQDADQARNQYEQAVRSRMPDPRPARRPWKPTPLPPVRPVPRAPGDRELGTGRRSEAIERPGPLPEPPPRPYFGTSGGHATRGSHRSKTSTFARCVLARARDKALRYVISPDQLGWRSPFGMIENRNP